MPGDEVPLRDHIETLLEQRDRLFDERWSREESERLRLNEKIDKLEQGSASREAVETYKRWQVGIAIGVAIALAGMLVTIVLFIVQTYIGRSL